ncbi:MAG: hypothetical protein L6R36_008441 [Xanthoria steineri]|nr:MAG: hypothetical protein L6R36_008441 [Xanthoria steineri]
MYYGRDMARLPTLEGVKIRSAHGLSLSSTSAATARPGYDSFSKPKSSPQLKDSRELARSGSSSGTGYGTQFGAYQIKGPGPAISPLSTGVAVPLKKTKMNTGDDHHYMAPEVLETKVEGDRGMNGTTGWLESYDQLPKNLFGSAVDGEVRDDEGVHADMSDDPDKLTDALLAYLSAKSQDQQKSLASPAPQSPQKRHIQASTDATSELTQGNTSLLTPNVGSLVGTSSVLGHQFEAPSHSQFASGRDAVEVLENSAHQVRTATEAKYPDFPPTNPVLAILEAPDNRYDAHTTTLAAPQPPAVSNPAPNRPAQSFMGFSRKERNHARKSIDKMRKMKEARVARLEVEAGTLVEDAHSTTRVAADEDANPRAVKRARAGTSSTSNHIPNEEEPPKQPVTDEANSTNVDVLDKCKSYERVIARLILGCTETKVRIKETVRGLQDQSISEQFIAIYVERRFSRIWL